MVGLERAIVELSNKGKIYPQKNPLAKIIAEILTEVISDDRK